MGAEKQPELFSDFKDRNWGKDALQKSSFSERAFKFTLTIDKIILIGICLATVLVLTFVFGFEKGRRRGHYIKADKPIRADVSQRQIPAEQAMTPKAVPAVAPPAEATEKQQRPAAPDPDKPYTIQVATFKYMEHAQKEADRLTAKGFDASIIEKNDLCAVCVGSFGSTKEASASLLTMKKIYSDCFIRRR